MRLICWFRRDLRLADNTMLDFAARETAGDVVPVFIFDDRILHDGYVGAAITAAIVEMLTDLDRNLRAIGSELIIRHGDPQTELQRLLDESQADGVVWNRDYTSFAVKRDSAVKAMLRAQGRFARSFHDAMLVEPEGLLNQTATPYKVYAAYAKRWHALAYEQVHRVLPAPTQLAPVPEQIQRQPIPTLAQLGFKLTQTLPPATEHAAKQMLDDFFDPNLEYSVEKYATTRNRPAKDSTSKLSMHLRMGTISPRTCLQAAVNALENPLSASQRRGVDKWLAELAWREYYNQIAFHFPHALNGALNPKFDAIGWRNDHAEFEQWKLGKTGYPLVDAGQRQLNTEAWMHNRVRMVTASFLIKHLLVDWRWGERYFMQQLRDGDPPSNNGGWQWSAGTSGGSSQPYFRIMNPITQSEKCDPNGDYIRRYVPELANVPDAHIHAPWTMSRAMQEHVGCIIGRDYPAPMVEHTFARERCLVAYRSALKPDEDQG